MDIVAAQAKPGEWVSVGVGWEQPIKGGHCLCFAGMAEQTITALAGGMPGWRALNQPDLAIPDWLLEGASPQGPVWWRALLAELNPLISWCKGLPDPPLNNFRDGTNLKSHPNPSLQARLYTVCYFPKDFKRQLKQYGSMFKYKCMGRGSDAKAGRMKLRPGGIRLGEGWVLPGREVYISRLLCYMYRGPPASPTLEACHMCENQLCLAPWHLCWDSRSSNARGHHVHKRDMRQYHSYNLS